MKLSHRTKRILLLALIVVSGPVFLLTTQPKNLALPLLVVPYVWLFVVLYLMAGWLWERVALLKRHPLKKRVTCAIVAAMPLSLLLLQSIHQLSIKDMVLVLGLGVIAILYVARLDVSADGKA